ncbi:HAD-IIB family hydrolase [Roseicyclus persicicus]|uniref:HAD-IIB family hydrolase n=1 Tax=Roseicyclus persicicus TaxID=2650661 RepID=A0A7X6H1M2_9RHOB|nr:HAD-IIB family hydrolase [Roseibacterium persicicum]NKX46280.1 HAD-IIB family hydrolase [Roseibacterium persicicum]
MTRHETFARPTIADKDFVLATDLDGTFLGGTEESRRKFYSWIEESRDRVGLIFVTGRDPGHVRDLTRRRGVPRPDYVVGDVGTTIAEVDDEHFLAPIAPLEAEIAAAWNDAGMRVQAALRSVPGLTLQSSGFRFRVSYDMDPDRFDDRAFDIVAELGLDALVSADRYFDVLPKGVSKGPSLLRLLTHLGVDNRKVLVAGDTLNDLSMLTMGLPAVAVGNSEPALISALEGMEHVHRAREEGVGGIAEAILHHKLLQ